MKIGILTFHEADNYGALLQAYALQKVLEKDKYNVEIIHYDQEFIKKNYKTINIKMTNIYVLMRTIISSIVKYPLLKKRKINFDRFRKEHLNISSRRYFDLADISGYDAYITGSDQVWNSSLTKFDSAFFLDFANSQKLTISYAASIGKDKLNEIEEKFIANNIGNIKKVSVREQSAKQIVESISQQEVERVLDPTLLLNKSDWEELSRNVHKEFKYILVYAVGELGDILEIAKAVSKTLKRQVIFNGKDKPCKDYNFMYENSPSVEEFLGLFRDASIVITNSYHGSIFSIIFNKNFLTIPHKKTGARMIELLELINLNNRIVDGANHAIKLVGEEIDYSDVKLRLDAERLKSLKFLNEALIE